MVSLPTRRHLQWEQQQGWVCLPEGVWACGHLLQPGLW